MELEATTRRRDVGPLSVKGETVQHDQIAAGVSAAGCDRDRDDRLRACFRDLVSDPPRRAAGIENRLDPNAVGDGAVQQVGDVACELSRLTTEVSNAQRLARS